MSECIAMLDCKNVQHFISLFKQIFQYMPIKAIVELEINLLSNMKRRLRYSPFMKKIFSFLKYSISSLLLLFFILVIYDFIVTGNFSWNTILLFAIISIIFYVFYRILRLSNEE